MPQRTPITISSTSIDSSVVGDSEHRGHEVMARLRRVLLHPATFAVSLGVVILWVFLFAKANEGFTSPEYSNIVSLQLSRTVGGFVNVLNYPDSGGSPNSASQPSLKLDVTRLDVSALMRA